MRDREWRGNKVDRLKRSMFVARVVLTYKQRGCAKKSATWTAAVGSLVSLVPVGLSGLRKSLAIGGTPGLIHIHGDDFGWASLEPERRATFGMDNLPPVEKGAAAIMLSEPLEGLGRT